MPSRMRMTREIAIFVLERGDLQNEELRHLVGTQFGEWFAEGTIGKIKRGGYDDDFNINSEDYAFHRGRGRRSSSSSSSSSRRQRNSNNGGYYSHYNNCDDDDDDYDDDDDDYDDDDCYDDDDDDDDDDCYQPSSSRGSTGGYRNSNVVHSVYTGKIHIPPEENPFLKENQQSTNRRNSNVVHSVYTGKIHIPPEENPFLKENQQSGNYRRGYDQPLGRKVLPVIVAVVVLFLLGQAVSLVNPFGGQGLIGSIGDWFYARYWTFRVVYHDVVSKVGTGFILLGAASIGWDRFVDDSLPFLFGLRARSVGLTLIVFGLSIHLFVSVSVGAALIALVVTIGLGIATWRDG